MKDENLVYERMDNANMKKDWKKNWRLEEQSIEGIERNELNNEELNDREREK